jgi:hypothetical protein
MHSSLQFHVLLLLPSVLLVIPLPLASCFDNNVLHNIDFPETDVWSEIALARRWFPLADEAAAAAASAAALRATSLTLSSIGAAAASGGDSSPETQQFIDYVRAFEQPFLHRFVHFTAVS